MAGTTIVEPESETRTRIAPRWNVVLLDDDDHTYAYVIEMLAHVFGYDEQEAYAMACEVDVMGRVIVWTGGREVAELKQEQIHAYGADPYLERSRGSMTAILELAD